MATVNARGFTLLETVVALGILSMVVVGILASFAVQGATNTRSEQRIEASIVAEQVLEFLRLDDPELMPTSGAVGPQLVTLNGRGYEVYTHFCTKAEYCQDTARHLLVEVFLNGRRIYDVETIFTQMR